MLAPSLYLVRSDFPAGHEWRECADFPQVLQYIRSGEIERVGQVLKIELPTAFGEYGVVRNITRHVAQDVIGELRSHGDVACRGLITFLEEVLGPGAANCVNEDWAA